MSMTLGRKMGWYLSTAASLTLGVAAQGQDSSGVSDPKRYSNLLIESLSADDAAKLPAQDVAEALQHLPGIQIERVDGIGTTVRIRGLDQNAVLLDGETILTG